MKVIDNARRLLDEALEHWNKWFYKDESDSNLNKMAAKVLDARNLLELPRVNPCPKCETGSTKWDGNYPIITICTDCGFARRWISISNDPPDGRWEYKLTDSDKWERGFE